MNDTDVKISVIIPVYNTSEFVIRQCVDSLIAQTFSEFELVIVDDGSTNNVLEVLRDYEKTDSRIRVITQKNSYAGNARNNGMKEANGKYLCFFDSDDYCDSEYLETMYSTAERFGSDVVICEEYFHDIDIDIVVPRINEDEELCDPSHLNSFNIYDEPDHIFQISNGWPWDKLFRKSFITEKCLKFAPTRTANDGYFVFMAMAMANVISKVESRLVTHRMGGANSLSNTREFTWNDGLSMLYEIKDSLVKNCIYEIVKKSFLNYSLYYIIWSFENMSPGIGREKIYNAINEITEEKLGIEKLGEYYYSDRSLFEKYVFIRNNSENEYVSKYGVTFPYETIPHKSKIALYAAGKNGKNIYREIMNNSYAKIVLWMDKRFDGISCVNSEGVTLGWVDDLKNTDYDYVLFTLSGNVIFEKVKDLLVNNGVSADRIIYMGKDQ